MSAAGAALLREMTQLVDEAAAKARTPAERAWIITEITAAIRPMPAVA